MTLEERVNALELQVKKLTRRNRKLRRVVFSFIESIRDRGAVDSRVVVDLMSIWNRKETGERPDDAELKKLGLTSSQETIWDKEGQ